MLAQIVMVIQKQFNYNQMKKFKKQKCSNYNWMSQPNYNKNNIMIIKKNQNTKKCGLINFLINYNSMNLKQINKEIDMKKKLWNQKIKFNNMKVLMKIKHKNCYNLWLIKSENVTYIYL